MHFSGKSVLACAVTALALAVPDPVTAQVPAAPGSHLYAPGATPRGQNYERTFGHYMKWMQRIPVSRNPSVHPNSRRNCAVRGDFVFMGTQGNGDGCSVPAGKAIALSFAGFECSTSEGLGDTFAELAICARGRFVRVFNRFVYHFSLSVDGHHVVEPRRWTFTTGHRRVDLPKRNLWGAPSGRTRTMTHGLFYIVRPFRSGDHVIEARGKDWEFGKFNFVYRFTVER